MRVKGYVVLRKGAEGVEIIALRLTQGAAQRIAAKTPGAYWEKWHLTKDEDVTVDDKPLATEAA